MNITPCPADSELAALGEGKLGSARRDEIVRHALTCEDCKDVLASLAHRHMQREEAPPWTAIRWAAAASLLLVVGGAWWGVAWWLGRPGALAPIEQLARATGERRLVEGRLSGGFAWAPVESVRGAPRRAPGGEPTRGSENWAVAGIAAQIAETAKSDVHALGVAHLLLGDVDEAIVHLERASRQSPQAAAVWSDFAAALIERGKEPEHAEDLLRGLDAAQTALNLTPDLPTAAFNRALALERLGLREAAIDAWESYRRVDPSSDWGREAASRLEKLRAIPVSRAFDEKAFEVACAGSDASAIEALAREHPQAASEALMSALGAWAELELAGSSEADAKLAAIERGAVAMKSIVGDPIVSDAVQEIRLASAERRRKLAEAHSTLVRGRVALDDARAEEAGRTLADAERLFERARSPYADLATLYRLSSTYFGNAGKHLPEIAALIARYPKDNVRVVGARARWLQGLTLGVSGRPFEAATALRDAADSLDGLRFASDATFVRFNEAVWWWTLGQTARAWTLHRRTFEQLDRILDPRRAQALMSQAAKEAEAQGFPQAALELQQVAAVYSRRHETAMDRCDGLIWLARAANRAGRDAVARQVAARARTALGEVPDPALHARLDAELSLVEGRLAVATTPKLAIEPADHAARWFERVGKENQLLEAYELRAEARARAGDVEAAAGDYRLALETAEKQRDRLDASNLRMSFFDSTWTLAREFVGFELNRGNTTQALEIADRLRATSLFAPTPASDTVAVIQRRLAVDEAVIFFSVLEERTNAWVIRRDGVHSHVILMTERDLDWEVAEWSRVMTSGVPSETLDARSGLFKTLIAPLLPSLVDARTVLVVPDGALHGVSWGSLIDGGSGRPWVDEVAVAVTPTLRCLLGSTESSQPKSASVRVVAVGNPAFDRRLYPDLPSLPGADREAREVAGIYETSEVISGADATADRVLTAASRADVLHIAAHAISNGIDPELSSIVLAPGGSNAPGGGLDARVIRRQELSRVRVVVLAACRSGDGPRSRMEGPLSLARPFLEHGPRAVIVSLWDLPDEASVPVMAALHRNLRDGLPPIEALRRATQACWEGPAADARACGGLQLVLNTSPDRSRS